MIKKLLFLFFTAPLFTQAQSIVTGDSLSSGIVYQNIKDTSIVAFANMIALADFDIDGDLTKDIRVRVVYNTPSPGWMQINKDVSSLNNLDVAIVSPTNAIADTMKPGSLIDQSLNWSTSGGASLYYYSVVGSTFSTSGLFNSINKYLAFRIKLPTDTIYGWFLMDFPNLGTIKVRSWAYTSLVLGVKNVSNKSENLKIFPNPAFNELNLFCKGHSIKEVTLFNCRGEEILKQKQEISSENFNIDISKLESGIYFLQLSSKDSIFTKKFIKE